MDKGCISCGAGVQESGHYYSQGHYSALRFSWLNTNGQCTRCNRWLHGNLIQYRKGLEKRIGLDKLNNLDLHADLRKSKKWTRLELEAIVQECNEFLKQQSIQV